MYRLRRLTGVAEHWVYVSCDRTEWKVNDLERRRWIRTSIMPGDECFIFGDEQSLAVGTDLLVFVRET
jgi:hypothetical protein